ncbi:protein of unknown function DUF1555 [Pseudodesulfovibrio mercurii]|uniref:NIDO domain-containing protein n=1 Tax=Pseudodesulfovibrio mercurii TaxID=641491 RepID=F0JDH6_9BACT|nr:nidogen-like domain-containing protein [Pseudodesulfovibrio mercurii]EGB13345.1 protein of unknown function DUF1555 [Pseudodesulfovibrio mercurii]
MKIRIQLALIVMTVFIFGAMASTAEASVIRTGLFTASTLAANDDGSTGEVAIGFDVNFFGNTLSTLYVNNNGNVTFGSPMSTYTPSGLSGVSRPIIAPFFADVDTRAGNVLTYGTNTVNGHSAFGVDWINVGYFAYHTDLLNSFQLILIDRSDIAAGDFDIEFNYDQIQWETGDASGGSGGVGGTSAAAGYSNGLSDEDLVYYQLAGSLVNGAFLDGGVNALAENSNIGVTGRYLFNVRNGVVIEPPTTVPEPSAFLLLGAGLCGLVAFGRKRFIRK